ncbi:MAG TPA: metallophosphoesterase [Chthoniobacterales bacterium]|nr:metallophosphoesterase [Chthoniobacterales bacterium]
MSIVTIIIASLLLLDVGWWFVADRVLQRAGWKAQARILHSFFFGLQLAGLAAVIASRRSEVWDRLPAVFTSAVYLWHLIVLPLLLPLSIAVGLVALLAWIIGKIRKGEASHAIKPESDAITRRAFLAATAAFTPQLFTVGLTAIALRQLEQFRVRRMTIPIRDLPAALNGLTIAHVSDIHAGRFTRGAILREMTAAVNDLRSDLVLLTGDLINGALHELPEGIETVRRLDAPSGVYMIEGNHDLFPGREAFESHVKRSGIPLLVNETAQLTVRDHPVQLLGQRWGGPIFRRRQGNDDGTITAAFEELIALRDPEAFPILLAHHPHAFDPAAAAGVPLTLAGHTHGGQLMLNAETGFGPWMFRYWSGHYSRGDSHLVVSNGVGNWFPLRTRAPAEIIHLTLQRV